MIITRTPFRISFAGGGTDLPAFFKRREGCALSASINKYMYIVMHPTFNKKTTTIKYVQTENVSNVRNIRHPIARQVLIDYQLEGVEIVSIADIPAGTGLASSSAYTVGLIHAANVFCGKYRSQERLAHDACEVEIEKLGEPIGKQDQYGCAVGGIKFIRFLQNGKVDVEPIILSKKFENQLNNNLLMFYTGKLHSASSILKEQSENTRQEDKFNYLVKMTELAYELRTSLLNENLDDFGAILNEGWKLKCRMASGITNPFIDEIYRVALENGAAGGKLLGAGGGGFLLFYCEEENQKHLRSALNHLAELPFDIEHGGTKVVYVGNKDWR